MSLIPTTLFPSAVVGAGAWTAVGGTLPGVLGDGNTTATYMTTDESDVALGSAVFDLPNTFTLATGSKLLGVQVGMWARSQGIEPVVDVYLRLGSTGPYWQETFALGSSTQPSAWQRHTASFRAAKPDGTVWTKADIDSLQMVVKARTTSAEVSIFLIDVSELWLYVSQNEKPVLSSFAVANTGQTITWTYVYTDPENDLQERYQAKLFSGTGAVADPTTETARLVHDTGEVFSSQSSGSLTDFMADSVGYRLAVRASDAGSEGRWSDWVQASITPANDLPAAPEVAASTNNGVNNETVVQGHTNLLTKNQSSLETDTTGWEAALLCTIARTTAQFFHGTASLRVTSTAAGTVKARTTTATAAPVLPGQQYRAQARFRPGIARSVRVDIDWYTAGDAFISSVTGGTVAASAGAWSVPVTVDGVAPGTAAKAVVLVVILSVAAGAEVYDVDAIGIAPWTAVAPAWDVGGRSPGLQLDVEASSDAGTTWTALRDSPYTVADVKDQKAVATDAEWRSGIERLIRARTRVTEPTTGLVFVSAWTAQAIGGGLVQSMGTSPHPPAELYPVIDGGVFNLNMPGGNIAWWIGDEDQKELLGVFEPQGRGSPVVVSDGVLKWDGQATVVVRTQAAWEAWEALLARSQVLLYRSLTDHRYLRLTQRGRARPYGRAARRYEVEYVEVESP